MNEKLREARRKAQATRQKSDRSVLMLKNRALHVFGKEKSDTAPNLGRLEQELLVPR